MDDRIIDLIFEGETIPFHIFPEKSKKERLSDRTSEWIRKNKKFHELTNLHRSRKLLKPDDVVLDCGSNMGNHTVFWSRICGCKVHSFESDSETFDILQKNVQDKNVVAHNAFLGNGVSEESDRIDDLIKDKVQIKIMRIAVNGHEKNILIGAERILKKSRPAIWLKLYGKEPPRGLTTFIQYFGYMPPEKIENTMWLMST